MTGRHPWHDRGYLPHFDGSGANQHVVFRLRDALPRHVQQGIERRRAEKGDAAVRRLRAWQLDRGFGSCLFRDPGCAAIMQRTLMHGDGGRYQLHAYVIMPNHVHVLMRPHEGVPLARIVAAWKSYSAHAIGRGPIWFREYYDRYIRDLEHWQRTRAYVERNPVVAGLCRSPGRWPWSSAALHPVA